MKKYKFASVHGGMLARKGQATPAIPSPAPHISYTDAPPLLDTSSNESGFGRRDIELWSNKPLIASKKDVKSDAHPAPQTDDGLCRPECNSLNNTHYDEMRAPVEKAPDGRTSNFKISVRLTAEQKRRMRTIAAQLDWPHQKILSNALDAYLDSVCRQEMSGCACLNKRLNGE